MVLVKKEISKVKDIDFDKMINIYIDELINTSHRRSTSVFHSVACIP